MPRCAPRTRKRRRSTLEYRAHKQNIRKKRDRDRDIRRNRARRRTRKRTTVENRAHKQKVREKRDRRRDDRRNRARHRTRKRATLETRAHKQKVRKRNFDRGNRRPNRSPPADGRRLDEGRFERPRISHLTEIPRSSVHRAMRAIARAEAKKEVAILEIASELLGERPAHRGRATGTSKKQERTTSRASKAKSRPVRRLT